MADAPKAVPRDVLQSMLEEVRLSTDQVNERFAQAMSPAYWSQLCPMLTVEAGRETWVLSVSRNEPLDPPNLVQNLVRHGWLKSDPLFAHDVARLVQGVRLLMSAGWPPAFVFLFEEAWQLTQHPAILTVVANAFDVESTAIVQLPFVWCHHVAARNGATGWLPHHDKEEKGGAMTVWIPLTDATLANGCMAFLPRGAIDDDVCTRFLQQQSLNPAEILLLVQSGHPVPARAGSVLAWSDSTIHWGGRSVDPAEARISIAVSFAKRPETEESTPPNWRGFLETQPPEFDRRLQLIAAALPRYVGAEPLMSRWEPLAQKLTATLKTSS